MENFRFPFPTTPEQAKDIAHAVEVDKHFAVYASARHASAGLHVLVVRATVFRVNHGEKVSTIRHETIDPRDGFTTDSILCDPESLAALLRSGISIVRQLAEEAITKVLAGLESGDIIPLEKETDHAI